MARNTASRKLRDEDDLEKIQTVTQRGEPVDERITRIEAARALYDRTFESMDKEFQRRARIKGQLDGNPPYDPQKLEELGLGYLTNINFQELGSILDMKASAHYELYFEVPTLIQCNFTGTDPRQLIEGINYGEIIAEEFSRTLLNWSGFLVGMDKVRRNADAYGLGIMVFQDEHDWRPKAFSISAFKPDPLAQLDIEELTYFFLDDEVYVSTLFQYIKNEKQAEQIGWSVKRVRQFILETYNNELPNAKKAISRWEDFQQRYRNNMLDEPAFEFKPLHIVHLLVREVKDNRISHYIFAAEEFSGDDFLFRKRGRFEKMSRVLWWLPYNNGDGYLRSLRGLASRIEPHADLSNRFLGKIFDAGFIKASLVLQPQTAQDLSKFQIIRMGPITVIPPELKAIQSTFTPEISQLVQLRELSSYIMRNNTGVFKRYPEAPSEKQVQKTAREIIEDVAKETRMEKAVVAFDYAHLDRLYREIFRRLTRSTYVNSAMSYPGQEEAKKFVDRCIERGVPKDLLLDSFDKWEIKAVRAMGLGSLGLRYDITNQILSIRELLHDERGKENALRDWLAARVSYQNVDRYLPRLNRDLIASNDDSIASLENNDFIEGKGVIVGSDQRHKIHIMRHFDLLAPIIQQVAQQQFEELDVIAALNAIRYALPHIQKHMAFLSVDPAYHKFLDTAMEAVKVGVQVYEVLQEQAAPILQAQQAERQAMLEEIARLRQENDELQVKMYEAKRKMDILQESERVKQQSLAMSRAEKARAGLELKRQRAMADILLDAEKMRTELALKAKELDAELGMKQSVRENILSENNPTG